MKSKSVLQLPIPESGCGDIRIVSSGVALEVVFEYLSDGLDYIGGVDFYGVMAFRFRDEMHSLGFAEGSYNCLVEIDDSDWLQELAALEPSQIHGGVGTKRHFAVLLGSNGYLEVLADSFSERLAKMGSLGD